MPVTEQQARAIAFLAAKARPHGAIRWDEAGIYANVMKVADKQLSTVVIAVMQAAEDRNAVSPGVIPTTGPHWRNPESAPVVHRGPYDASTTCGICGFSQPECRRRWTGDHEFEAVTHANARVAGMDAEASHRRVLGLREATLEDPPARPEPETSTAGTERVAPIRDALATTTPDAAEVAEEEAGHD